MRIARLPAAEEPGTIARALEQREACRLPERDAPAGRIERTARLRREQAEGVEAEQHAPAQGVRPADERRVGEPQAEQALRVREHFRTRGAGGRYGDAEALERKRVLKEIGERVRLMENRPAQLRGKLSVGLQPAVSVLGGADAGSGCADDDRDAIRAVTLACRSRTLAEIVLQQSEPGESIVAALPGRESGGKRGSVPLEPLDAADPRLERRGCEVVRPQTAAPLAQRPRKRGQACAGCARHGVGGHAQRLRAKRLRSHSPPYPLNRAIGTRHGRAAARSARASVRALLLDVPRQRTKRCEYAPV